MRQHCQRNFLLYRRTLLVSTGVFGLFLGHGKRRLPRGFPLGSAAGPLREADPLGNGQAMPAIASDPHGRALRAACFLGNGNWYVPSMVHTVPSPSGRQTAVPLPLMPFSFPVPEAKLHLPVSLWPGPPVD